MSSEMRELIAKWRDEAANPDSHIPAAGLLHCADALEAILGDDDEEECPHTMRYQDGDGSVMCCDCGALIAPVANALLEYRGALKACLKAMDVARDTIQPITTAQIRLHNLNPQTDKLLDAAADKAIALLARTEAGADGVVDSRAAFERWAKPQGYRLHIRDTPGSARLGQYGDDSTQAAWEAWTASRTTRPQDASGDAERYRWLKSKLLSADFEPDDYVGLTFALPAGSHVSANLDATLDAAMQAKEAKS